MHWRLLVGLSISTAIVVACGSSTSSTSSPGTGGSTGKGGQSSSGGSIDKGGAAGTGASTGKSGSGGSISKGGAAGAGASTNMSGEGGEAGALGSGGAGSDAGSTSMAGESGSGGAAGSGQLPQTVSSVGCFARSGDGWDTLTTGIPATTVVPVTQYCGGSSISDNAEGFAPQVTPTTIVMTREFVVDDSLLEQANFSISFRADDAADFILNGNSVASCTPPSGNTGACSQQGCITGAIPLDALLPNGQVNHLEIVLTNLLSVSAGGGNFGWTSISYSICAEK